MENVYEICFYGGLILAVLLLIASIVLFIVLKIPKVIGDLTGSTARKKMKEMKEGTIKNGSASRKEQEKYYNMGTGKITVKETKSSKEERKRTGNDSTELLGKAKAKPQEKKDDFEETDILRPGVNDYQSDVAGEETEVLGADDAEATDVLQVGDDSETDVLATGDTQVGDDSETDVLATGDTQVGDDSETDVLASGDTQVGDDSETDVLASGDTQVGDDSETDVLSSGDFQADDDEETDVLRVDDDDEYATDILRADDDDDTSVLASNISRLARKVKVIYNIVEVHSDERL